MAQNNQKDSNTNLQSGNIKTLRDLSQSIKQLSDDIYADTYYTGKNLSTDLNSIRDGINQSLDQIFQRNMNINGRPNISNLYSRLINSKTDFTAKDAKVFEGVFEDEQLMNSVATSYTTNTYIKQFDAEIDLICKYMPKLEEAIEIKKDMVLCADQFNRDFIVVRNKSAIEETEFFNSEIDILKDKYNLADMLETSIYRAWKYGEDFLYIVPYKKAFDLIFDRRKAQQNLIDGKRVLTEDTVLFESSDLDLPESYKKENKDSDFNFTVTFKTDYALSDSIVHITEAANDLEKLARSSINNPLSVQLSPNVIKEIKEAEEKGFTFTTKTKKLDKHTIPDDIVPTDKDDDEVKSSFKHPLSSDGTFVPNNANPDDNKVEISKIPGCLVKRLERERVIPIYIEDICMGYYYIEVDSITDTEFNTSPFNFNQPTLSILTGSQQRAYGISSAEQPKSDPFKDDIVLKQIASKLSSMIDKKFINNNQDLYRELYMILKYDEKFNRNIKNINVTYIPPDDIEHIYFKMDPHTHRGISLLQTALIPAKIFISMSMSSVIGMLTRGQDKRVYYVKQQVETNISKTLLSAINQIKKGNFGVRNLENLMGILNITGMYNDYFIPRSANGESPIDFEVLEGQKIDPNMDLLEKFEDYAVGSTGIPAELIDARRGIDFATQLTMTNAKHVRMVYKDQTKVQIFGGRIITKIYNAEFNKNSQLALFLPPPLYITLTNTAQLFTNVEDIANKIITPRVKEFGGDDDMVAAAVTEYIERTLGSYINFDMADEIVRLARIKMANKKKEEEG